MDSSLGRHRRPSRYERQTRRNARLGVAETQTAFVVVACGRLLWSRQVFRLLDGDDGLVWCRRMRKWTGRLGSARVLYGKDSTGRERRRERGLGGGEGDWWPFCWTRSERAGVQERQRQSDKSEGRRVGRAREQAGQGGTRSSDQVRTHLCSSAVLGRRLAGLVPSASQGSP